MNVAALIDERLREEQVVRKPSSWHPSALGQCLTGAYLERAGFPAPGFDERTLRVFSAGKTFEDWVVSTLGKAKIELQTQVEVRNEEYDIHGYADLIVTNERGDKEVLEVKSQHSKAFWYLRQRKEEGHRHHREQLWTYLWLLNIPSGRLVYVSKDDMTIAEFPVFLNDTDLKTTVLDQFTLLNDCWKAQLPPKPSMNEKDWRAKYCRYHHLCTTMERYFRPPMVL